jgi:NAD-dependent deacetylase
MREEIAKAAEYLLSSRHTVALTGAGISVESGIPPFRGPGSLWEKFDPMEYAHINAFLKDPEKIWKTLIAEMRDVLMNAAPNAGHFGLARLEELGLMGTVITQNIDGLHQKAGSTDVIEFHGNFAWLSCLECGIRREIGQVTAVDIPPRCDCGGIFRPDCVFFGELIPPEALDRSQQASARCDVMLVVGTSATVQPAAYMPVIARQRGAVIIEINPEPTPLTGTTSQVLVQGKAGEVMNELVSAVESLKK